MEQGEMRCDVNLSLKPKGSKVFGNRAETKNLNSFKSVARTIEFEITRQTQLLDCGGTIDVETRRWDDTKGKTFPMRSKESAADYRYFPDPDLYKLRITAQDVERIQKQLPILGYQLRERFTNEYGLPEYDADVLTRSKDVANFYLDCVSKLNEPKAISNWIMVDLMKIMNDTNTEVPPVAPAHLVEIVRAVLEKTITKTVGLQLLDEVIKNPTVAPMDVAKSMGLLDSVSETQIIEILESLKREKPNLVADYAANAQKVLPFIIGQVMKQTRGKAKSEIIESLLSKVMK